MEESSSDDEDCYPELIAKLRRNAMKTLVVPKPVPEPVPKSVPSPQIVEKKPESQDRTMSRAERRADNKSIFAAGGHVCSHKKCKNAVPADDDHKRCTVCRARGKRQVESGAQAKALKKWKNTDAGKACVKRDREAQKANGNKAANTKRQVENGNKAAACKRHREHGCKAPRAKP